MGWAYCENAQGRPCGYGFWPVFCDVPGCLTVIDRGLAYVCGNMHDGGEFGCGGYFCSAHLTLGAPEQLCLTCTDEYWFNHCLACEVSLDRVTGDDNYCYACLLDRQEED